MEEKAPTTFKIIIVGAGITGLVLANIFKKIGVDYVLLEAHADIEQPVGGSFGIWPNAARIFDQIGCWDDIRNAGQPLEANNLRNPDGSIMIRNDISRAMHESFGYEVMALERKDLVEILHRNLGANDKIQGERRVKNIIDEGHAVRVALVDGDNIRGDIVVGCDGVHSTVRQLMWENANGFFPSMINVAEKKTIASSYRCLVGVAPLIPGLALNELNVIQGQGVSMTIVTQPTKTMFFACIKENVTTHWPKRSSFSAEDAEQEAAQLADLPITENTLFGEVWKKRCRGYLCSVEEGILTHWHFRRLVLVGDSVHKLSPVGAHSGNCAVESAAALANSLCKTLFSGPKEGPSTESIESAFEVYQSRRLPRLKKFFGSTYMLTRLHTWDTYWHWLIARYVLKWMDGASALQKLMVGAEKVDFFAEPRRAKGFAPSVAVKETPGLVSRIRQVVGGLISTCRWLMRPKKD